MVMHISILLLVSQFFFWSIPIDWQMKQENVVVRGAVVDETSGSPIAGATVYAISPADVLKTTSDPNGHFIFLTLLPGTYRLCAAKYGYAADCSPNALQQEQLYAGFEYGATVVLSPQVGIQRLGPLPAVAPGTR
jgi:hypothetical protein